MLAHAGTCRVALMVYKGTWWLYKHCITSPCPVSTGSDYVCYTLQLTLCCCYWCAVLFAAFAGFAAAPLAGLPAGGPLAPGLAAAVFSPAVLDAPIEDWHLGVELAAADYDPKEIEECCQEMWKQLGCAHTKGNPVPANKGSTLWIQRNYNLPLQIGEKVVALRKGILTGETPRMVDAASGITVWAMLMLHPIHRQHMVLKVYGTIPLPKPLPDSIPTWHAAVEPQVEQRIDIALAAHLLWLFRTQGVVPDAAWGIFRNVLPLSSADAACSTGTATRSMVRAMEEMAHT
jgi:hypothetical protein